MKDEKLIKYSKVGIVALIFSLIALASSMNCGNCLTTNNFISGDNIEITQEGNNITITGAATWTLSGLTTNNLTSTNIITTYINEIQFNEFYLDFTDFYINSLADSTSQFYAIQNNTNDILNIENNLTKYRQTAFEINLNSSSVIKSDLVLLPYDMVLKNITTQLDNSTGYFNYTVNKYSSYPSGKTEIITINSSSYINVTSMNENLNRHESIELIYNNFSKVNNSIILFEFEYQ